MKPTTFTLALVLTLVLSLPLPALAFWGGNGDDQPSLNLQSGYDVNTVTTVAGHILAIQPGEDRPNVQLVLESNDLTLIVCIGPQRYWAEKGVPFNIGDQISVRGSKAQGDDGTIYILAQKIEDTTQDVTVLLRNELGRPVWAGMGMGRNRRQPPPGPGRPAKE